MTDVDQGVTRTYVTDGAGLYDTGAIPEDHYQIKFTKDGFRTYVRGPVTLTLGIVTVNANLGSRPGFAAGDGDDRCSHAQHRERLAGTDPGGGHDGRVAASGQRERRRGRLGELYPVDAGRGGNTGESKRRGPWTGQQRWNQASINGNVPYQSYLQDGATTTLPMSQNSDVTIFETTAEVKVSATAFSAQYGLGDIVYNQITKSGTDKFHGAAMSTTRTML